MPQQTSETDPYRSVAASTVQENIDRRETRKDDGE
jgi:hypothetical protein